jgi:hypothetical protein
MAPHPGYNLENEGEGNFDDVEDKISAYAT